MHRKYTRAAVPALSLITAALLWPTPALLAQEPDIRTLAQSLRQGDQNQEKRVYIVQLASAPAATVFRRKHKAKSGKNIRFNKDEGDVRTHVSVLRQKQKRLLASIGAEADEVYSYSYAFNGVAVKLTPLQAERLRLHKGVKNIWLDRHRTVSSGDSAAFLGLRNSDDGLHKGRGLLGEDIIIGVIDSGIAPGHPSFSDQEQDPDTPGLCRSSWAEQSLLGRWLCGEWLGDSGSTLAYAAPPAHWQGSCETGAGFDADDCNNKLIGAQFFRKGFDVEFPDGMDEGEFDSPADADGHGTHVASIAAGNITDAAVMGRDAGTVRGMAPRARVAVYKACWLARDTTRATCANSDLIDAIEHAVADGVDIINYSIGSLDYSLTDPDDLALLAAADAGVLTAVSAGNNGKPNPNDLGTIESPGATPWVITAGATSRPGDRLTEGVRVNKPAGIAADYESKEAGFTPRLSSLEPITGLLVLADDGDQSTDSSNSGGNLYDGCTAIENSEAVSGNIALIQRGNCQFDVKVQNAQDAGAVAVVVYNNDVTLLHMAGDETSITIPAVMIGQADGELIRNRLLSDVQVEMTLDDSIALTFEEDENTLANFSSRGPDIDFLKPDIVAPGKEILGGHTRDVANGFQGEDFQYLSGTSQSAPHIAGIAALIKEAHPDWTPAEIKSALMTTARQNITLENGNATTPFDIGAGHVVPNTSIDPGLLYDVTTDDFDEFLCRIDAPRVDDQLCTALTARNRILRPEDLNLPSIQVNDLVATRQVTRRVRNPGELQTFTVQIDAPDGIEIEVEPDTLQLGRDESADYTVTFSNDGSESNLNNWKFGSLEWSATGFNVYSPLAIISTYFEIPAEVRGSGTTGAVQIPVQFGYNGNYVTTTSGLLKPCVLPDNNQGDGICTNTGQAFVTQAGTGGGVRDYSYSSNPPLGTRRLILEVPANQLHLRIAMYDELTDGIDDLDLFVWRCVAEQPAEDCKPKDVRLAGFSAGTPNDDGTGGSDELIDISDPIRGYYIVDVHGYDVDLDDDSESGAWFNVYAWYLSDSQNAGNLNVTGNPGTAIVGTSVDLTASWNGLDDSIWLGLVTHSDDDVNSLGYTLIEVDNKGFGPIE